MKANPNIPKARTNPLASHPSQDRDAKAGGLGHEFGDVVEDVEIQSGMPARNLRTIGMGIAVVGLTGFLLWPGKTEFKGKEQAPPVQAPLVTDLIKDLNEAPAPVTLPEFPQPPSLTQKNDEPKVDERLEMALIASMAASEVDLRGRGVGDAGAQRASKQVTSTPSNGARADIERLLAQSQGSMEKLRQKQVELAQGDMPQQGSSGAGLFGQDVNGGGGLVNASDSNSRFMGQFANQAGIGSSTKLQAARAAPTLYEGTLIRTVLTRGLNSSLPGTFTAKVSSDLYDSVTQRILLVPRGSEVTCTYNSDLLVGQEAILAACTRLRLPNGRSFSLSGASASTDEGISGMPADINNHFFKMFGNALVVGAASYLMPRSDRTVSIVGGGTSDTTQTAGSIMGQALSQVVQATIGRNLRIPPTGTVDIGTSFTLTLTKDVEMEPYLHSQR
jgi:type IV secretion system protein VirB10